MRRRCGLLHRSVLRSCCTPAAYRAKGQGGALRSSSGRRPNIMTRDSHPLTRKANCKGVGRIDTARAGLTADVPKGRLEQARQAAATPYSCRLELQGLGIAGVCQVRQAILINPAAHPLITRLALFSMFLQHTHAKKGRHPCQLSARWQQHETRQQGGATDTHRSARPRPSL